MNVLNGSSLRTVRELSNDDAGPGSGVERGSLPSSVVQGTAQIAAESLFRGDPI